MSVAKGVPKYEGRVNELDTMMNEGELMVGMLLTLYLIVDMSHPSGNAIELTFTV
jgi:hypothetical protein